MDSTHCRVKMWYPIQETSACTQYTANQFNGESPVCFQRQALKKDLCIQTKAGDFLPTVHENNEKCVTAQGRMYGTISLATLTSVTLRNFSKICSHFLFGWGAGLSTYTHKIKQEFYNKNIFVVIYSNHGTSLV